MQSFRSHFASDRPPNYRTPSPPPWSPINNPIDAKLGQNLDTQTGTQVHREDPEFRNPDLHRYSHGSARYLHRSDRSMDVFASIAIATQHTNPPLNIAKRTYDADHENARAKRARTEVSPPQRPSFSSIRPATSYTQTLTAQMEEAELLVHFAQQPRDRRHSRPEESSRPQLVEKDVAPFDGAFPDSCNPDVQPRHGQPVIQTSPWTDSEQGLGKASEVAVVSAHIHQDPSSNDFLEQPFHSSANDFAKPPLAPRPPEQISTREGRSLEAPAGLESDSTPQKEQLQGVIGSGALSDASSARSVPGVQDKNENTSNENENEPSHTRTPANLLEGARGASPPDEIKHGDHVRKSPQVVGEALELNSDIPSSVPCVKQVTSYNAGQDDPNANAAPEQKDARPEDVSKLSSDYAISQAVCAACRFTKNSLSIESENNATSWISCDGCKSWFHFACAGFKNEREVRSVDKYRCKKCKPIHGATSYVRKSARAHTAIDYAGLHQGVLKTSDDRPEHHYIQPIRNGTISFLPESFPRMRPELVTAEYFEKGNGMREPVVIPASLNPRPCPPTSNHRANDIWHPSIQGPGIEESANLEDWLVSDVDSHRVLDEGQDALDMVMPKDLTVRKVAELYGPEEKIEVIDVKSQNGEGKKWNMRRWVDYYESEEDNKIIRNVISLEVSQSRLGRLIRRPQIVRDLDLQDSVWPEDLLTKGEYPHVQFYCLMSVADCFTDFHIDFGGSSVFYHILKGKKTFLFIPPKEKHLKKYEEWCNSPAQNWTFLPDQTHECYRVDLSEGDTMLIPSGWIHAVWTPEDSLVIGGNFLSRLNYGMQLRIAQVEKDTGVARKFRYPHFQKLHWFTAFQYIEHDPLPAKVRDHLESGSKFERAEPAGDQFDEWGENSKPGPENFHARFYSQAELDGLPDLLRYLLRTALIENGTITEGISAETRNAVKKSIPRGHGEPLDVLKTLAIWCAWKRGNESIPYWAYPDAVIESSASEKLSAAASKKLTEEAALKAPRRQSQRMHQQKEARSLSASEESMTLPVNEVELLETPSNSGKRHFEQINGRIDLDDASLATKRPKPTNSATGSHRKTACESCRRRRRACKHKDVRETPTVNGYPGPMTSTVAHKEAFLNDNGFQEKLSSIGGLFNSLTSKTEGGPTPARASSLIPEANASSRIDDQPNIENSFTGLVAADGGFPTSQNTAEADQSAADNGSPSRPRTKACSHCRKSKRRCIHDAFGNEDPIKVAESAVPRPHARKTNRPEALSKRANTLPISDSDLAAELSDQSVLIDPNLEVAGGNAPTANMLSDSSSYHVTKCNSDDVFEASPMLNEGENSFSASIETSMVRDQDKKRENSDIGLGDLTAADQELSTCITLVADAKPGSKAVQESVTIDQASSLVSPPASSHETSEGSPKIAEGLMTSSNTPPQEHSSPSREYFQRYTPESASVRRASQSSSMLASIGYDAQKSKKQRSTSAQDADEESLRLIKELQAQDLGLRRRAK